MKSISRICPVGRILSAGIAVLLVGGCGETPPPETEGASSQPPADAAPNSMAGMRHVSTPLHAVGASDVSGEAMAMHAEDAVVVTVDVQGLPEEGEFQAHIHAGSCAEGGPVVAPLNPVMGTADGMGTSTATLEPDEVPQDEPAFVQVHSRDGTPIACGDIQADDD